MPEIVYLRNMSTSCFCDSNFHHERHFNSLTDTFYDKIVAACLFFLGIYK